MNRIIFILFCLPIISCSDINTDPNLCMDLGGGGPLGYTNTIFEDSVYYSNLIVNNGNSDIIYFKQNNSTQDGYYEYHISTMQKNLISTANIYTFIVTKHDWIYYYDQSLSKSRKMKINGDSLMDFAGGSNYFFVDYDYDDDEIGAYTYTGSNYYGLVLDPQENIVDTVPILGSFAHNYITDDYAFVNSDGTYIYNRMNNTSYKFMSYSSEQAQTTSIWCWIGNDLIWTNWCGLNQTQFSGSNSVIRETKYSDRLININYLPSINKLIAIRIKNWDDAANMDILHTSSKIVLMDMDGTSEVELNIP